MRRKNFPHGGAFEFSTEINKYRRVQVLYYQNATLVALRIINTYTLFRTLPIGEYVHFFPTEIRGQLESISENFGP